MTEIRIGDEVTYDQHRWHPVIGIKSAGTVVIQQADEGCPRAINPPDRLRGVRRRTP